MAGSAESQRRWRRGIASLFLGLAAAAPLRADLSYFGVNLASAEFAATTLPGVYGIDYVYPTAGEVSYFMGKGLNTFRVPFLWERMQPTLGTALDATELDHLDAFVEYATAQGASVVLDVHNFAAYRGEVIGATGSLVGAGDFSDLWYRLADHYKDNSKVIFGLMNEPVGLNDSGGRPGGTTEAWLVAANAAILDIRAAGATNLVLVPGNGYSGAWSWSENFYGTPNGTVMAGVVDPGNNFAYEVHQYLDADSSGEYADGPAVSATIGAERLAGFTQWLADHHARGFLGEFGVPSDALSLTAMDDMLDFVDAHADQWLGWSYWAGGPYWPDDYPLLIRPEDGVDKPQMAVLEDHLAAVPEPGGGALLLAAGLLVLAGRLRRLLTSSLTGDQGRGG